MILPLYDKIKAAAIRPFINKRGTECYILSYPKCGRTWLRLLIGKVLCDQFGLPEAQMIDTFRLSAAAPILRTHFSHDYSSIKAGFPYNRLPNNKDEYRNCKVLFMIRDPRDTIVSSYFQATKRVNKFQGTMSEFVRDERFGIKKIVAYYNLWHKKQTVPRAYQLLRYEELHQDPAKALISVLRFMELEQIDEAVVETAVAFASFKNMKKMEKSGKFKNDKLQPTVKQDANSYKVRQGKVGGYRDYLSAEDLVYIRQTIQSMGCPYVEKYYQFE